MVLSDLLAQQASKKNRISWSSQICFLSAATGKALTTVFAGFALTLVSLPNITFTHAFVAGFVLVLMRQRPGSVKTPFFFTSLVPTDTRLFKTPEQAFVFKPCSVAIAFKSAPFVMAFAPPAFMAFFIGGNMMSEEEQVSVMGKSKTMSASTLE